MSWRLRVGLCVVLLIISAGLHLSSAGQILNLRGFDWFRRPHAPENRIVIAAIDSASLNQLGRWPWPRDLHARLLNRLVELKPQAVAFDVSFLEASDEAADRVLAESLAEAAVPVFLATELIQTTSPTNPIRVNLPLESLRQRATVGLVNVEVGQDGVARLLPQSVQLEGETHRPLALVIANQFGLANSEAGLIDFAGPAATFPTYSVAQIFDGTAGAAQLADKIVLIGATASDLHDTVLVPLGQPVLAGVEWQANVLDNLLGNRAKQTPPWLWSALFGWLLLAGLILIYPRLSARAATTNLIGLASFFVLSSWIAWQLNLAWSFSVNLLLVLGLLFGHGFYRWSVAEAEKRRLRETIQPYFSPQVMRLVLEKPEKLKLGGELREVTVLFADIRNFTTITEALPPERLTRLLQEYFTELSEEILVRDGVLEKFIGDAMMAFWGAPFEQPDKTDRAVGAALAMIEKVRALAPRWQAEGYPLIDIGIGINTGLATVGHTGSAKRFDYAAIGDTTNTASRLEGLNKEFGTHIIISESTKQQLTLPIKTVSLGNVIVKGRVKAITVHQVLTKNAPV